MTNKEFKEALHAILKPLGYKRKGNFWRLETQELEKVIDLQKSNYSNKYYVNYGFNLKKLDYDGVKVHIFGRLEDDEAFDLENEMSSTDRLNTANKIFENKLLPEVNKINTEIDVLNYVKTLPTMNIIPWKVKEYLNL